MPADAVSTVLAYPSPPGVGGLGRHAAHLLATLHPLFPRLRVYSREQAPAAVADWRRRYTWLRYTSGRYQALMDRGYGQWLGTTLAERPFDHGYFFTHIAYESLVLARARGARTVLDSPTGHIRHFRDVLQREHRRWAGMPFYGVPNASMVERVEEEYVLADRIRVSSTWARQSLIDGGVDPSKIFVAAQHIDTRLFVPSPTGPAPGGPLRVVFVGSLSLAKGYQYLLDAVARLGPQHFTLDVVGATGDPWNRRVFDRLTAGLTITHAPGDPRPAYQRGEIFVLPTLHDGFGLVVGEAMASGLPVITTDRCGAADWITPGVNGWIVPAGRTEALAAALDEARAKRPSLQELGRNARQTAARLGSTGTQALQQELRSTWMAVGTPEPA